jgi:FkbM family methyltransferase
MSMLRLEAPRNLLLRLSGSRHRLIEWRGGRREASSATCLNRFEGRVSSQNGEDGILEEIFRRIGSTNRSLVEIGCGDGRDCNARRLIEVAGGSGLLMTADPHEARSAAARFAGYPVRVAHSPLRADQIDGLLEAYGTPPRIDLLCIDVDGNDYWLWERLTATRPRVVCIEFNASHLPWKSRVMPYDPDHTWDGSRRFGASLRALSALADENGFSLVGCDRAGVNAFFVETELASGRFDRPGDVRFHYRSPKYVWPWFGHPRRTHARSFEGRTGRRLNYRPSSNDRCIWEEVARDYPTVPRRFSRGDTVVDVGCHIGSFSALAAMRGAGRILGFEANHGNLALAERNLSPFPQCEVRNFAVWRSDQTPGDALLFVPSSEKFNTGGGSVLFERPAGARPVGGSRGTGEAIAEALGETSGISSHPVATVALDDVLRELTHVRCLKIDVEGAEFPILLTATLLHRVEDIVGEFHECPEEEEGLLRPTAAVSPGSFRIERLAERLCERGFFVAWRHTGARIGTFFACRGASPRALLGKRIAFRRGSGGSVTERRPASP